MIDATNHTPDDDSEKAWEQRLEEIVAENEATASQPAVPQPAQPQHETWESWAEAQAKKLADEVSDEEWTALAEAVRSVPGANQMELGDDKRHGCRELRIYGVTLDALALFAVVVESFNRHESQATVPAGDEARLEVTSMWMDDRTPADWTKCLVASLLTKEPGKLAAFVNEWRRVSANKLAPTE